MTTYRNDYGEATAEYVEGDCSICGKPRLQCATDFGNPFIKIEEEEN